MNKRELIDAILEFNHTAAPEFLARFGESELKAYLDRIGAVVSGKRTQPLHTARMDQADLVAC